MDRDSGTMFSAPMPPTSSSYAGSYYRAIFTQNDPGLFPYRVNGYGFNLTAVGGSSLRLPAGPQRHPVSVRGRLLLTKGAHNLKFGANYRRYDITDYTFSVLNNPLVFMSSAVRSVQRQLGAVPSALPFARDPAGCSVGHGPVRAG